MSVQTRARGINWFAAVCIHADRLLKHRLRSPAAIASAVGMPVVMIVMTLVIFDGMVEQFTGSGMNVGALAVMVAFSSSFTAALMGAGDTVHERHQGLPDRLATMPGHVSSGYIGRVVSEVVRAEVSVVTAMVVGLIAGAEFGSAVNFWSILGIMTVVAITAGAVGVMLGYVAETPQGAVSFAPLVMAAMFFNTAMMPREMYAEVLRPVVDGSPITAITQLVSDIRGDGIEAEHLVLFLAWFGGLLLLSIVVLSAKARSRR